MLCLMQCWGACLFVGGLLSFKADAFENFRTGNPTYKRGPDPPHNQHGEALGRESGHLLDFAPVTKPFKDFSAPLVTIYSEHGLKGSRVRVREENK